MDFLRDFLLAYNKLENKANMNRKRGESLKQVKTCKIQQTIRNKY